MKTGTTTVLMVVGCGTAAALVYALFSNKQNVNRNNISGKDIFPRRIKRKTGSTAQCVHSIENYCQSCRRLKTFCLNLAGYGNGEIPDNIPDHDTEDEVSIPNNKNNANIGASGSQMRGNNNNATSVSKTDTAEDSNKSNVAENDTESRYFNVVLDTPEAKLFRVEDLPKEGIRHEEDRKGFSKVMREAALSIYNTYNNIVPPLRSDKGRVIRKSKKLKSVRGLNQILK